MTTHINIEATIESHVPEYIDLGLEPARHRREAFILPVIQTTVVMF